MGATPAVIGHWIANNSPDQLKRWLRDPDNHISVAEEEGAIVGIGGFAGDEIQCNYVDPEARFKGVSKALLAHMEAAIRGRGVREARLLRTGTAHRFYLSAGWQDAGEAPPKFPGVGCRVMTKRLG